MADQLSLRPVRAGDIDMLDTLLQDPAMTGEYGWFGWHNLRRWRHGWEENGLIGADSGTLIVDRDGGRLGLVNWRRHQPTPAAFSWEIGIALIPQARGHGYGAQAQRLLAEYLFAHTAVHRIWAATETGNVAEQKALEKAGFTREGIQRGVGWRDGAWRDGVTYSLLRTDPRLSERESESRRVPVAERAAHVAPADRHRVRRRARDHREQFLIPRRAADDQDLPRVRVGRPHSPLEIFIYNGIFDT